MPRHNPPADNLAKTIAEMGRILRRHSHDANSAVLDVVRPAVGRLLDIQKRMKQREGKIAPDCDTP